MNTYCAEISRKNPTLLVLLVDQSGSTNNQGNGGKSIAQSVAAAANETIENLIDRCTRDDGVKDYIHICAIGYGAFMEDRAYFALAGNLEGRDIVPLSELDAAAESLNDIGGTPVWLEPVSRYGTPMAPAIALATEVVKKWCFEHPDGFPPTVVNVSDGEATKYNGSSLVPEDPEKLVNLSIELKRIGTTDGNVLFYNFHLGTGDSIMFPSNDGEVSDRQAQTMLRMSSAVPERFRRTACEIAGKPEVEVIGMAKNASPALLALFFDLGTRAITDL